MPEPVDDEYPFMLLTGRGTSAQWHTGTRTEKSDVLRQLRPASIYVETPSAGRAAARPRAGWRCARPLATRQSRRPAFITPTIQPGQVFIPMHYVETNRLTIAAFDPSSRQPAYKACAVRLEKVGKPSKRKARAPFENHRSADTQMQAVKTCGHAVEPGILPVLGWAA